jgi:pimeloyl-ACP methyl ester carboxylesterase
MMNSFPQNSTMVLVHGAWTDGSCWKDVISPLERHGTKVICAPLPFTLLTDDVSALIRAVERTSGAIVLVGHVYGGAVVGAITRRELNPSFMSPRLRPMRAETVAQAFHRGSAEAGIGTNTT